jgi:hypothetical protein
MDSWLKGLLGKLRSRLSDKAHSAYEDRDAADTPQEEAYAAGEAHAFGVAADEVRDAEDKAE